MDTLNGEENVPKFLSITSFLLMIIHGCEIIYSFGNFSLNCRLFLIFYISSLLTYSFSYSYLSSLKIHGVLVTSIFFISIHILIGAFGESSYYHAFSSALTGMSYTLLLCAQDKYLYKASSFDSAIHIGQYYLKDTINAPLPAIPSQAQHPSKSEYLEDFYEIRKVGHVKEDTDLVFDTTECTSASFPPLSFDLSPRTPSPSPVPRLTLPNAPLTSEINLNATPLALDNTFGSQSLAQMNQSIREILPMLFEDTESVEKAPSISPPTLPTQSPVSTGPRFPPSLPLSPQKSPFHHNETSPHSKTSIWHYGNVAMLTSEAVFDNQALPLTNYLYLQYERRGKARTYLLLVLWCTLLSLSFFTPSIYPRTKFCAYIIILGIVVGYVFILFSNLSSVQKLPSQLLENINRLKGFAVTVRFIQMLKSYKAKDTPLRKSISSCMAFIHNTSLRHMLSSFLLLGLLRGFVLYHIYLLQSYVWPMDSGSTLYIAYFLIHSLSTYLLNRRLSTYGNEKLLSIISSILFFSIIIYFSGIFITLNKNIVALPSVLEHGRRSGINYPPVLPFIENYRIYSVNIDKSTPLYTTYLSIINSFRIIANNLIQEGTFVPQNAREMELANMMRIASPTYLSFDGMSSTDISRGIVCLLVCFTSFLLGVLEVSLPSLLGFLRLPHVMTTELIKDPFVLPSKCYLTVVKKQKIKKKKSRRRRGERREDKIKEERYKDSDNMLGWREISDGDWGGDGEGEREEGDTEIATKGPFNPEEESELGETVNKKGRNSNAYANFFGVNQKKPDEPLLDGDFGLEDKSSDYMDESERHKRKINDLYNRFADDSWEPFSFQSTVNAVRKPSVMLSMVPELSSIKKMRESDSSGRDENETREKRGKDEAGRRGKEDLGRKGKDEGDRRGREEEEKRVREEEENTLDITPDRLGVLLKEIEKRKARKKKGRAREKEKERETKEKKKTNRLSVTEGVLLARGKGPSVKTKLQTFLSRNVKSLFQFGKFGLSREKSGLSQNLLVNEEKEEYFLPSPPSTPEREGSTEKERSRESSSKRLSQESKARDSEGSERQTPKRDSKEDKAQDITRRESEVQKEDVERGMRPERGELRSLDLNDFLMESYVLEEKRKQDDWHDDLEALQRDVYTDYLLDFVEPKENRGVQRIVSDMPIVSYVLNDSSRELKNHSAYSAASAATDMGKRISRNAGKKGRAGLASLTFSFFGRLPILNRKSADGKAVKERVTRRRNTVRFLLDSDRKHSYIHDGRILTYDSATRGKNSFSRKREEGKEEIMAPGNQYEYNSAENAAEVAKEKRRGDKNDTKLATRKSGILKRDERKRDSRKDENTRHEGINERVREEKHEEGYKREKRRSKMTRERKSRTNRNRGKKAKANATKDINQASDDIGHVLKIFQQTLIDDEASNRVHSDVNLSNLNITIGSHIWSIIGLVFYLSLFISLSALDSTSPSPSQLGHREMFEDTIVFGFAFRRLGFFILGLFSFISLLSILR